MDYGESESVILYEELQADFLLIDDKKARSFAESMGVQCIGTIGLLSISKDRGLVDNLKPLFIELIQNKRFYSLDLLNKVLNEKGEFNLFSSE
jgi:predicted nucleic acid-binding protein